MNSDFTLKNCLLGGVKLAKNADPYKYIYSGYVIGFNSSSGFSLTNGSVGKNGIIFEVGMSSSVLIDNKKKYILVLVKRQTQGLGNTTLAAEAQYSIKFSRSNIKFCLSLCYDGSNNILFANTTKNISF